MKILLNILCAICAVVLIAKAVPAWGDESARPFVRNLVNERGPFCGAVVLAPGLAMTADHCAQITGGALRSGGPAGTPIARGDERLDIALLAFPADEASCPCVRLAAREAEVDEPVYVVGYPLGVAQVLTVGASQGVQDNANLPYGRRLVTTALVAGGNSGGGVFVRRDGEFQLVGILVEASGDLSFAVPLADIRPFLEKHLPKSA